MPPEISYREAVVGYSMNKKILVFIIALVFGSLVIIMFLGEEMEFNQKEKVLKIALPSDQETDILDPANITRDYQYNVLESIYSTLFQFDYFTNEIKPYQVKKFYWEGNALHLVFDEKLRTTKGDPVTPEDAISSLKRLSLKGNQPTHRIFKSWLCPGIEKLSDDCQNMQMKGDELILHLPYKSGLILRMLASLDFAIIPKDSINKFTLDIEDYSNTTGRYAIKGEFLKGDSFELIKRGDYSVDDGSADRVIVYKDYFEKYENGKTPPVVEGFLDGTIDHIPTANTHNMKTLVEMVDKTPEAELHVTNEITLVYMVFTPRGMLLPAEKRRSISKKIYENFEIKAPRLVSRYKRKNPQIFILGGFGSFSAKEITELEKNWAKVDSESIDQEISIGVPKWLVPQYRNMLSKISDSIVFHPEKGVNIYKDAPIDETQPILAVAVHDCSFNEDFSLLNHTLDSNLFSKRGTKAQAWLSEYLADTSADGRFQKLKDLQYESLFEDPSIIPLFTKPYMAISRNGWKMSLPRNTSNNPLWMVHRR